MNYKAYAHMVMGTMIFLMQKSALIAGNALGSDFMTEIYTLPSCPICEMVKKKLAAKGVPFVERKFEDLPEELETDRAPVLAIDDAKHLGYSIYLLSPMEINEWIQAV